LRLLALVVAALALAVPLSILHVRGSVLVWDAEGYRRIADGYLDRGFLASANPYRTYGYPMFLAAMARLVGRRPEAIPYAVVAGQVLLHLVVATWASRRLAPRSRPGRRFLIFAALALQPFLLFQAAEQLTEVMGATLATLAVALALSPAAAEPLPAQEPARLGAGQAFLAMLAAGLATAVRPVNAIVAAALGVVILVRVLRGHGRPLALLAGGLGAILPLIPQAYSNALAFGKLEPLVVERMYAFHLVEGTRLLKNTTSIAPGSNPHLEYRSPFSDGTNTPPSTFFREKPFAYAATLLLHTFAFLDWDQVFSYNRRVAPWYRWITTPLSFLALLLAGVGLRTLVSAARTDSVARWNLVTLAAVCLAYLAVMVPIAVENRFSLPIYLLLAPWTAIGAALLWARWREGRLTAGRILTGLALVAVVSLGVSLWIAGHARLLPA
jgi:hypothetical protein